MLDSTSFRNRLVSAADSLHVDMGDIQKEQILRFLQQLDRWNKTYNLTAIRQPEQMLVQHIFDSLAVVPVINQILDKNTVSSASIVDVGSGGGLPGIVLAIMTPCQIHCVDAVEKKTAFIRQMSGTLSLPNLQSHHARIESMPGFNADIVISRAFSSLRDFVQLAGDHISENGCLLAMKGKHPDDEIDNLQANTDWRVKSAMTLSVPELDAQRCVLRLSREGTL